MVRATEIAVVFALGTAAVLAGCDDKPAEKDSTPTTTASTTAASSAKPVVSAPVPAASASAPAPKHAGPPRGPGGILFAAVKDLTLEAEQKTKVDAARDALKEVDPENQEAAKEAVAQLRSTLAAQVKAGKIETAKLTPSYDAIEKVAKEDQEKDAEAVNALHAALNAEQRKAVAATVRAKQAAVDEKIAKHDAKESTDKAKAIDAFKRPPPSQGSREVRHLTADLGLDEAQQKEVEALASKDERSADVKKQYEALAKEFEKDTFDAKKLDLFKSKALRQPLEDRTKLVEKLTKLLKPEQREKLAAKIEKGPGMGHGAGPLGGPGGHGGMAPPPSHP